MKHELKIWPQYYQAVKDGTKTFEVRKNDRGFQKGDIVELREYDPEKITNWGFDDWVDNSPLLTFEIGYVLPIDAERVVFSLIKSEAIL